MFAYTIMSILLSTVAVFVTGQIMSGARVETLSSALVIAVVLGVINSIIRPLLLILTLPINILTLGLFTFVIMGFCVWLTAQIVPGFHLASFWWAMGFALVLAIVNSFLDAIVK